MDPFERLDAALTWITNQMVRMEQATVVSASPLTIEGSDGDLQMRCLGWYDPAPGDQVAVLRFGTTGVVLGAMAPNQRPPGTGTVTGYTAGAAVVTVNCGGSTFTLPKAKSYTPAVGDRVIVSWSWQGNGSDIQWSGVVVDAIGASPVPAASPKAPVTQPPAASKSVRPPTRTSGNATVTAAQVGTWRGGSWRTDTPRVVTGSWSGRTNSGYWFYGRRFLPYRGAKVTGAWIYLHADTGGQAAATPVRLFLHDQQTRSNRQPADNKTQVAQASLADGGHGWFPLPTSTVQQLVDGGWAGIAALNTSAAEYTNLLGLAQLGDIPADALSGAIRFTWERTS